MVFEGQFRFSFPGIQKIGHPRGGRGREKKQRRHRQGVISAGERKVGYNRQCFTIMRAGDATQVYQMGEGGADMHGEGALVIVVR
jgi:hypothetical protein